MRTYRHYTFLLVLLLALALAACGGSDDAEPTDAPDDTTEVDTQQPLSSTASPLPMPSASPAGTMAAMSDADGAATGEMAEAESRNFVQQPAVAGAPPGEQLPPTPDAMTFDNPGTNPFFDTEDDNLSTFALDVDTGSYTVARSYIMGQNQAPPPDAVRVEEFVNYFYPGYDSPGGDDAFAIYLDAAPAPFGFDDHYMMRVGIQGRYVAPEDRDAALLIFVIDVSGSMDREDRLGTVKESLALLVEQLRDDDRVGIVVYSSSSRAVLEPTAASNADTILSAIDALQPEGSTNVEDGLRIGYDMARENMREDETTRIIVLSDGVANVGNTGPEAILETIRDGVDAGITLSTIGFGMGNYNDVLMEQLANDGNGNYYYVDTLNEARRIFVFNLTGTLQVIAYDARIQVEFNPEVADRYRLLGYENRAIADEDFRNDTVDAGEVGAGQSVTALYELALEAEADGFDANDVIATVYVRYEDADSREVVEVSRELTVGDLLSAFEDAPATFRLQAAAAEFAELLRGSIWAEDGSLGEVRSVLRGVETDLPEDESVAELADLVERATQFEDR